eukprot:CAMPEP_0115585808 /NCGR_PEP_ID=MMETSP0272-20121206/7382_1 /TAXON_ID=71861 /ORGANISM="Scrippsiella trochoidea, Strain CCMP3099" /LENGTH=44 /DNA_ID= /DNA_START= /DNA_END= /DNA_ORIENTATION=
MSNARGCINQLKGTRPQRLLAKSSTQAPLVKIAAAAVDSNPLAQ